MRDDFGEMLDTSPTNRARYYALLRALGPERRAAKGAALSRMVHGLARASLAREFPHADSSELALRLAVRLYGAEVAAKVYGSVPGDAR